MIINSRETCIAYRCPYCGSGIKSMVGVFALSGAMKKLKCSCSASELTVNQTNDGKLRITVPCLLCGGEHSFAISSQLFWKKELFVYPCPMTAMELVFIGTEKAVSEALDRSEKELLDMLKEMGDAVFLGALVHTSRLNEQRNEKSVASIVFIGINFYTVFRCATVFHNILLSRAFIVKLYHMLIIMKKS